MLASFDAIQGASMGVYGRQNGVTPATSGLTVNAVWTDQSASGSREELSGLASASAAVYLTLNNTDSGIIIEAGGPGVGLALYAFGGVVYFQCGDGGAFTPASNRGATSWTIPNAADVDYLLEWSANGETGYAELFVDGVSVDVSASYTNSTVSGGNEGGLGRVFDLICANRGFWTNDNDGIFTNTIARADIFVSQTVGGA
jgi:hypothetical protein